MRKLVVLKLDGDLEYQGFHVILEIGEEGKRPAIAIEAALPANQTLRDRLREHW